MFGVVVTLAMAAVSMEDFVSWQAQHGKQYGSKTETAKRFRIFQENANRIESMRANNKLATFGLNKFADLSKDEFVGMYNNFKANVTDVRAKAPLAERLDTSAAPSSYDWRNNAGILAPVQDQGQCGSCWAFSATCNMESRYALAKGTRVNKLAEQALVDCDKQCGQYRNFNACDAGCEGGLMPNAFLYAAKNGMPTEASYPYTATDGSCKKFTSVAKFTSWEFVPTDEAQIAAYLAANSPVSIAVDASNWQFYTGGIMSGSDICPAQNPSSPSLDHGVTLVGYGTESGTDYWIVRNSWAASWGEKGYVRLVRGTDYCGVALFACSVKV
jgi:C1A family cysteine protease